MVFITRKGAYIQEQILNYIEKRDGPITSRQLALELHYSWNTIQQHCLELLLKEKIQRIIVSNMHLWSKKDSSDKKYSLDLLNSTISEEIDKQIEEIVKTQTKPEPEKELYHEEIINETQQ